MKHHSHTRTWGGHSPLRGAGDVEQRGVHRQASCRYLRRAGAERRSPGCAAAGDRSAPRAAPLQLRSSGASRPSHHKTAPADSAPLPPCSGQGSPAHDFWQRSAAGRSGCWSPPAASRRRSKIRQQRTGCRGTDGTPVIWEGATAEQANARGPCSGLCCAQTSLVSTCCISSSSPSAMGR
jgi:hypothetical protein